MKKKLLAAIVLFAFLKVSVPVFSAEIIGVYFPPYPDSYKPIVQLYDSAQRYIHLAIYSLTKDEIANALVSAHSRGVEVKVIIDNQQAGNQYADDEMLESAGIQLRRDKISGMMHNKFCIIDDTIVYTGSYNHTQNATENNDENYIVIKDIGIAHIFETQFQKLWEKHK